MQLASRIVSPYKSWRNSRIHQGDIFRDVILTEDVSVEPDAIGVKRQEFQYIVVLSQDCDLEQDFDNRSKLDSQTHDKYLQNILFCPAYVVTDFKEGSHLKGLNLNMHRWESRDSWKKITQNMHYRYHRLQPFGDLQLPELIIDFKHYATAPRDIIYRSGIRNNYLGTLAELFRENLSSRFAHYLSRVALPDIAEV